jgi:ribonucleotide monophosphatase NagD (HAD superfamily)
MTLPHALPHLGAVAGDYDILLCDVWGVIHNGRESWATPCEALTRFNREGGHVVLISNSPRPASDVIAQLDGLGVPREAWKAFVTSGRRHPRRTGQAGAWPGLDRRARA